MINRYYQQQQRNALNQQKPKSERKKQTRLSISFKDDELWIYEKLQKYSCPSAWVKDLLSEYLSDNGEKGC